MVCAVYARKSTDQSDRADETKSVHVQIERATAFAREQGWTVGHVFSDDGVSGAEFERRPGFLRLLNALKPKPQFQILIVSELSRLGREQLETGYALKQLAQAGVHVWSYLDQREIPLDSPANRFLVSAVNFASEMEREQARLRTTDVMIAKFHSGHVVGSRVYGYDNHPVAKGIVGRVINQA